MSCSCKKLNLSEIVLRLFCIEYHNEDHRTRAERTVKNQAFENAEELQKQANADWAEV